MGRVFLSAALTALLAGGCSAGGDNSGGGGAKGLVVTREDGSRIDLPDPVRAWCGREDALDGGGSTEQELFVLVGELPNEDEESNPTFLIFAYPTKGIDRMPKVEFPVDEVQAHPRLFVLDPPPKNEQSSRRDHELSSQEERAKGSFEVEEWGCDKGDPVRISFAATLQAEHLDGPTADVNGKLVTVIGDAPAPPE